jgi:predicted permease
MRSLLVDLNSAVRTLLRTPFFTCVAAGTLTLGIAFNVVVFSVVNSVLLRPLPYANADKIMVVRGQERHRNLVGDLGAPAFFFVRDHAKSLQDVAALYPTEAGVNLAGAGTISYVKALRVSRNFFRALNTAPMAGRTFSEDEDKPGGPPVAVLSYSLWSRTLNRVRLGKTNPLRINGEEYTAIGVMPEGFHSYPQADLWLPLQLSQASAGAEADYRVIASLRAGASVREAGEELRELSEKYPLAELPAAERVSLVLQDLQDFETRDVRQRLLFLLTAVFLVLLIACANISMLLLVRASARTHEIAIRSALGSSRSRLIQVFMFEGTILALLGGLFGIILAKELLPLVLSTAPPGFAPMAEIHVDWRVAAFALGMSTLTALLFGIAPMTKFARVEPQGMLGESNFRTTASARQTRTGRVLLVTQTALTLILLSGSILLLRHLVIVERIEPGFDVHEASVAQVSLSAPAYATTAPTARVLDHIVRRLQSLPFVRGVATINGLPLERGLNMPMHPTDAPKSIEGVEYRLIGTDYFTVMGISMVQGRSFTATDGPEAQPVAIVNEALARKWWPGMFIPGHSVVVGEEMGPDFADKPRRVVGVAADVHQSSLEYPARPTIFVPIEQTPDKITGYANKYVLTSIVVRLASPENIAERVRMAVESSDPDLSIASFRPMSRVVTDSLARDRFYTFLTVAFGAFALLTIAVGFYGLLSYHVGLRAREIAVRISLGARRSQVVMLVVWQGMQLVGLGASLGVAAVFFLKRLVASELYNTDAMGLHALTYAVLLLGLVAMLASLLSAFRIASVEPMVVLRNE